MGSDWEDKHQGLIATEDARRARERKETAQIGRAEQREEVEMLRTEVKRLRQVLWSIINRHGVDARGIRKIAIDALDEADDV